MEEKENSTFLKAIAKQKKGKEKICWSKNKRKEKMEKVWDYGVPILCE